MGSRGALDALLDEIASCTECAAVLPHDPRPVLQAGRGARLLIIGQAPGRRVHESGIPWDDPSGERLRDWLGVSRETFYDPEQVALVPMGFCFPGTGRSGDLPPRPECAPLWHRRLLDELPEVQLSLHIGAYSQQRYLGEDGRTLTERVAAWREAWPERCALPHPSPRNNRWLKANPWFEQELVPDLRVLVADLIGPALSP